MHKFNTHTHTHTHTCIHVYIGACYDKVQQTVRRTLADLTSQTPPHAPSRSDATSSPTARSQPLATKSGGKTLLLSLDEAVRKALGLCRVAITMELGALFTGFTGTKYKF
jgi:hypothetical protein